MFQNANLHLYGMEQEPVAAVKLPEGGDGAVRSVAGAGGDRAVAQTHRAAGAPPATPTGDGAESGVASSAAR